MKIKFFTILGLLGLGLFSMSANAAKPPSPPPVVLVPFALTGQTTSPFSITNSKGATLTITPSSGFPVITGFAGGDDNPTAPITNQNYDTIGNAIKSAFSLSTLPTEAQVDIFSNTYKGDTSVKHIVSDMAYNILSLHFGGFEVAFRFANLVQPGTAFDFTSTATQGGGLSNYRVYNSIPPTTATPIPAAVWLFGSGLAGLIGATRRKSKTAMLD